ncbi:MAG: (2Fe-2S)-binding protein [Gammaproteobacteria bacterium]|nr:(2Fe-2S)-binding protein [Gammaproteobacteria bacterium]MDH3538139.1 (2Fe-2S)-binding protein [Gammaproteobacteria bacterium]
MFKRIQPVDKPVHLVFEEQPITACEGDSVAAALLAAGVTAFRQVARGDALRGPYCMIGNCYECRVEIDGKPNLQACQQRVRDGIQVRLQRGLRKPGERDEP